MNSRKILAVIQAATGDRVVVGESELSKSITKHLPLPNSILLELTELTLRHPNAVYLEIANERKCYHFFYRFQEERFFVDR